MSPFIKLAEIYELSEEERERLVKDLKTWKDNISVTAGM